MFYFVFVLWMKLLVKAASFFLYLQDAIIKRPGFLPWPFSVVSKSIDYDMVGFILKIRIVDGKCHFWYQNKLILLVVPLVVSVGDALAFV